MRQVDSKRLKAWIESQGEDAKVHLHLKSGVSLAWIEKAVSGRYHSAPRRVTQDALCEATGLAKDELFPLVGAKGKRRAS